MTRNIKLTLQYDGSEFSGYELQPGQRTVRGELENALRQLFKTRIKTISASRTDSGVHACAQVVAFELKSSIPVSKVIKAVNSCLPDGLIVVKAEEKGRKFHARYAPKTKEYEYLIYNGELLPPFYRKRVWQVKPKLNLVSMRKAARVLSGRHDFSSFCASGSDDKDFVRQIAISIRKRKIMLWEGSQLPVISFKVKGNGFLYKMVRNLVGTLVEVGLGRKKLAQVKQILKARDRKQAGRTAPGHGLCLVKVNY
jgi:tRNA pseudouridine38-40 synthase